MMKMERESEWMNEKLKMPMATQEKRRERKNSKTFTFRFIKFYYALKNHSTEDGEQSSDYSCHSEKKIPQLKEKSFKKMLLA